MPELSIFDQHCAIVGRTGSGKAQSDDALVLTPTGFRRLGDLVVGDLVTCPSGKYTSITGVFPQGYKELFAITFEDGRRIECCDDHLWKVWRHHTSYETGKSHSTRKIITAAAWTVVPTSEIRRWFANNHSKCKRAAIPLVEPFAVEFPAQSLPIAPYALGALLGDGHFGSPNNLGRGGYGSVLFSTTDDHILTRLLKDLPEYEAVEMSTACYRLRHRIASPRRPSTLRLSLDELQLFALRSHDKYIPDCYKRGSATQRLSLLQGLLDTDGSVGTGGTSATFSSTSHRLACDLQEIAWSLGCIARISRRQTYFRDNLGQPKAGRPSWRVSIICADVCQLFSLPRKQMQCNSKQVEHRLRIKSIGYSRRAAARCITIDGPQKLYVTTNYIVTHNSFAARGIVERWLDLKRRVCIIDPTGVWYGLRASADGKKPGFPVIVFGGDHADVPIGERSGERLAEIITLRNLPAVIDTSEMTGGERHQFMTEFLETVYRKNKGVLHLVVDEADDVCPQNPLPESKRMAGAMDKIVRRGRSKGFRVMMLTQRPAVIHKNILAQASTLIAMRLPAPQDRKAIEDWIRGQADVAQADKLLSTLAGVPRGEGWIWAPDHRLLRRHKFGAITTFDSMKAPEPGDVPIEPTALAAVEVGHLRALLEEPAADQRTPNPAISRTTLEDAERRGYARGRAEEITAYRIAWARLGKRLEEFAKEFDLLSPSGVSSPADVNSATDHYVVNKIASISEGKKDLPKPTQATLTNLHPAAIKILQVLARGIALTWGQAATLAGLKARGGHFNSGRKALRNDKLIDETGDLIRITAKGRGRLGDGMSSAVDTPEDYLAWWLDALPDPASRMLAALARERGMTKHELGTRLGLATTGGYWNTGLAVLRQNHLISIDGDKLSVDDAKLLPKGNTND